VIAGGSRGTDFQPLASDFTKRGEKAMAPAVMRGRSGVKHEFAFALLPDTGSPKVVVDTEISTSEADEVKVLKFYVKVYDVSPEKAVLCVSPRLSKSGASLAREYGIVVLEDEAPLNLVPMAEKYVETQFNVSDR
jgi:hypothetical protein